MLKCISSLKHRAEPATVGSDALLDDANAVNAMCSEKVGKSPEQPSFPCSNHVPLFESRDSVFGLVLHSFVFPNKAVPLLPRVEHGSCHVSGCAQAAWKCCQPTFHDLGRSLALSVK